MKRRREETNGGEIKSKKNTKKSENRKNKRGAKGLMFGKIEEIRVVVYTGSRERTIKNPELKVDAPLPIELGSGIKIFVCRGEGPRTTGRGHRELVGRKNQVYRHSGYRG